MDLSEFTDDELSIFYSQIGKNIKNIRKDKGITQMQLALSIGHNSVGHIAKAELNKYNKHFSIQNIYKIAKTLNIDLIDIFKGIETKS